MDKPLNPNCNHICICFDLVPHSISISILQLFPPLPIWLLFLYALTHTLSSHTCNSQDYLIIATFFILYIRDNFFTHVLTYLLLGVSINSLEHLEDFCWIRFSSLKVKVSEIKLQRFSPKLLPILRIKL